MNTKKALRGLLGLLGSFLVFLPAPALLLFNLITHFKTNTNQNSTTHTTRRYLHIYEKKKHDQAMISNKRKRKLTWYQSFKEQPLIYHLSWQTCRETLRINENHSKTEQLRLSQHQKSPSYLNRRR